MQSRIGVQGFNQRQQTGLVRRLGQHMHFRKNAEFGAGLLLASDIDLEAASSPTRTNARPGTTPRSFNSATRCPSSRWICAATARPSTTLSGSGIISFRDGVGFQHLDALDGQHWRFRPALGHAF